MDNYAHILNTLKFKRISENEWRMDEVLDNDVINYATLAGNENGGLHFWLYKPDEPPAVTFIKVTIQESRDKLEIYFDYAESGHTQRTYPLAFFELIFTKLLTDRRESQITKILK